MIHWPTFGLAWTATWLGLLALIAAPYTLGLR
jgi:hypothetical protein